MDMMLALAMCIVAMLHCRICAIASAHAAWPQCRRRPSSRGGHCMSSTTRPTSGLDRLAKQLPQLAKMGINCLILEVNYGFEFQSHPELRQGERHDHEGRREAIPGRLPRERHRAGAAVHVPGAPVVGEEHASAAHQVSGARSDARRVSEQRGHLLPRMGSDESQDERNRLRPHR